MSGQRGPANGQDVSALEFEDSAWDSNDMMREPGTDAPDPSELEDDDDPSVGDTDDLGGDRDPDLVADDDGEEVELEAGDDEPGDDEQPAEGDEEAEEGDEEEGEEYEPIEPPANWPEVEKQFFAEIPPALQHAYMARARAMTADYQRKTQQLAGERQYYAGIQQAIAPHVQNWAMQGMAPASAIAQLIELSNFATRDPQGFIQYFANQRGVDLQAFGQQQNDEYLDPQVAALRGPLSEVQAGLNQLRQQYAQGQQQQQRQQRQAEFNYYAAAVENFSNQTDDKGQPAYPYFDEVAGTMTALLDGATARGERMAVPDAYRIACQATPSVQAKIAARSLKSENARRRQAAEKARRAAASVSGSLPANGSIPTENMSIRDTIRAAQEGRIA